MSDRSGILGNGGAFSSLCAGMYFGPDAQSLKSGNITVAPGETVWVHAQNLLEDECIMVRQVINGMCVPYFPIPNTELVLDECSTSIALGVEGTYVLELDPPEALGRVSVVTNINCGTAGYMSWLASFTENTMPKQINATQVVIEDQNNCFVSATVEGALAELAQSVKNGLPIATDGSLNGDGLAATPLSVNWADGAGDVPVVSDNTLAGNGTTADPLSVNWADGAGDVPVVSDNTLAGNGTTADPLSVNWADGAGDVPVVTNAPITGDGTTASPLDIDFTSLTPADCQAIADCIANDAIAAQTLYSVIHQKLVDFDTVTGVLSVDCNGDGNPFT